ncbi:MAG: hypothetical protein P2A85_20750 [Microcoleus anatoxicus]|uniref:hypothetical protein n=1 Tax=Microcoleus anatoxicus TaxID=2705319 RepID=UPI003672A7E8
MKKTQYVQTGTENAPQTPQPLLQFYGATLFSRHHCDRGIAPAVPKKWLCVFLVGYMFPVVVVKQAFCWFLAIFLGEIAGDAGGSADCWLAFEEISALPESVRQWWTFCTVPWVGKFQPQGAVRRRFHLWSHNLPAIAPQFPLLTSLPLG